MKDKTIVTRGEIYYADMSPVIGSEQGGMRPVAILQNDMGNKHAPTTIVAPLTSQAGKSKLPTHIFLTKCETGLSSDSTLLLEQIRTIDKRRLREKVGEVDKVRFAEINKGIAISLGLA